MGLIAVLSLESCDLSSLVQHRRVSARDGLSWVFSMASGSRDLSIPGPRHSSRVSTASRPRGCCADWAQPLVTCPSVDLSLGALFFRVGSGRYLSLADVPRPFPSCLWCNWLFCSLAWGSFGGVASRRHRARSLPWHRRQRAARSKARQRLRADRALLLSHHGSMPPNGAPKAQASKGKTKASEATPTD